MRNALNRFAGALLRRILRFPGGVAAVNLVFNASSMPFKLHFYRRFARIFWDRGDQDVRGFWKVKFLGHQIVTPLRGDSINLDWIFALSLIGHDREVLDTYEAFIKTPTKPSVFIDIGANFGMHSLLMSKAGIVTYSFEPNPSCRKYSEALYDLNDVYPTTIGSALGSDVGTVELAFPKSETWLGSIIPQISGALVDQSEIITVSVPVQRLDDISFPSGSMLIKMDVEGAELMVLEGAWKTLKSRKPAVIFEANNVFAKQELAFFFARLKWPVYSLPFDPDRRSQAIISLADTEGTNFIAMPN